MPVLLTDEEASELRELLVSLHVSPHSGGEIHAMGGLRSVVGRPLLDKLGIRVPENSSAETLYLMGSR